MNTLFDNIPEPRTLPHNGTSTSREAAQVKQSTGSASSDRNRIAVYLHDYPEGATRQQIAETLRIKSDSVRPRVIELIEAGFIFEDGTTRVWNGHGKSKVLRHRAHREAK